MSASKNTPPSNVTSDEVDAAVNMASLSSSTLTMFSVGRQFVRGFPENTSKPTNNPPESTVVVEATSTVADEEVQVRKNVREFYTSFCVEIVSIMCPIKLIGRSIVSDQA